MRRILVGSRAAWGIAALMCAGCGGKAFVREGFLEQPPARVAVLPFVITYAYDAAPGEAVPESHLIGRDTLRTTMFRGVAPLNYHDVPLEEVDQALTAAWGPLDAGAWQRASAQELGRALGADALIYGDVHRLVHFTTPLYTETSLDATLRMVDARTAETLWRKRVKVAERGGVLIKKGQVVDLVKDQVRSLHPEVKFLRISEMAVRAATKQLPNPPYVALSGAGAPRDPSRARIAVLPLAGKLKKTQRASDALRRELSGQLRTGQFDVIELGAVDAALTAQGWSAGSPLPEAEALQRAAEQVDADLLVRGTVTDWGRSYWVVQSWVTAGMALELVDAASGRTVWSDAKKNRRQSGILKGPTGYKSVVTAPVTGLKTSNLERVGANLARTMVDELISAPAVLAYTHGDVTASAGEPPASIQQ